MIWKLLSLKLRSLEFDTYFFIKLVYLETSNKKTVAKDVVKRQFTAYLVFDPAPTILTIKYLGNHLQIRISFFELSPNCVKLELKILMHGAALELTHPQQRNYVIEGVSILLPHPVLNKKL